PGFSAVHLGLNFRAQRRDAESSQPAAQRTFDSERVSADGRLHHPWLAAALSRHGSDRKRVASALRWRALHPVFACGFPTTSVSLAASDLALPRDDERWAKLRL